MIAFLNIELFEGLPKEEMWWRVTITCIATFLINLPFGYLRGCFRKLSFWWFVAIHAPVPLVIVIRKFHKLELTWELAPFLLGSFFLGQLIGRKLYKLKPYKSEKKST